MKLLLRVFQFIFGGCQHSRLSRVFTIERKTYQVCFECGQKFDYSWTLMHPIWSSVANNVAPLDNTRHAEVSGDLSRSRAGRNLNLCM
jgi:hypothetical protein